MTYSIIFAIVNVIGGFAMLWILLAPIEPLSKAETIGTVLVMLANFILAIQNYQMWRASK